MLQLILGISGSGKSSWIMGEIKRRAEQGQKSLLLVPEQFTSSTEKRIFTALGDSLSGYVDSYSFSSLAEHILQTYGGAAIPTISDAGRAVLVRRAVESLGEQVQYYRRHRRSITFCRMAAETINELKSAGVSGEQLAQLAPQAGSGAEKLQELALILSTYETLLAGSAMDPGDRVQMAAERLVPEDLAGTAVFVDEFDTFNAPKRKLLGRLMQAADVTVALCADGMQDFEHGTGLFSGAKDVAGDLISLAHQIGTTAKKPIVLQEDRRHGPDSALERLNRLLVGEEIEPVEQKGEITLYKAADRSAEARAVAAAICRKAREGTPYNKMAVICRTADLYLSDIRYQFALADIPLFFDEPTTPENTPPARAVKAAVELLRRGLSTENIMGLVKSGLCDLSEEQQCALENYAYTWPLTAKDWRAEFTLSPSGYDGDPEHDDEQNLTLAEQARQKLIPPMEEFIQTCRGKTAMGISKGIYFLLENLGAQAAVNDLAARLRHEQGIPAAEEVFREWNVVVDLLNQIGLLLGQDKITADEYGEMFTVLLRSADLGHIPETLDAVIFTTAGRMRLDDVEACFVMGLSEGEFPQAPGETGLLTHSDRDALIRQDIKMPDCFENRLIREKICFYKALTAAKSHLWLSWPGGSGGPELTSALDAVQECFAPQEPLLTTRDLAATPAMAMEELGHSFYENNAAAAAIFAALQERPEQKQAMDTLVRTAMEQPFQALDTKALEAVLGRGLRLSPSRVENFYTCRFAYFLQYVLRVRPRHRAELSPNQSGSLVHWVLEQAIKRSGEGFKTLPESKLRELAKSLAEEYARTNMPDTSERFQYLLRRLESNVADLLLFLQKDLCQSEFTPVAFEQPIGDGPGAVPPVRLKTPDGHEIRVVGTIDRVDAYRRGDTTWLRVVDYKTGTKSFKLEEVYCGLDCQMLLYLFTLTRNGKKQFENPAAAGVMYLMADPSPTLQGRKEAAQEKAYALDGLLIDDSSVVHAMDQNCTGLFVPVSFKKDGSLGSSKKLADAAKMGRICRRIDQLVVDMAAQLYKGQIQAEPLCKANGRLPCDYCDYRQVCRHEDGWNEKTVSMPEKYFDHDPIEKGEGNEQNQMDPGTENSH